MTASRGERFGFDSTFVGDLERRLRRDVHEPLRVLRVGARDDHRHAGVTAEADPRVDRNLAEELGADLLREPLAAAVAEDLVVVTARRALVVAHVLDDAEDRNLDLLEHRDALHDVDDRDLLRRRHHHRARDRDQLRQRELHVAGAGRQIADEVVELAPLDVAEELLEQAVHHRAAPHDRLVLVDEEADRDHAARRGGSPG